LVVEIDSLMLVRSYVKSLILNKPKATRIEERYPLMVAVVSVFFDLGKLRSGTCPFCGRSFNSNAGLYKHLMKSGRCKVEYWLSLYSVSKVMTFFKKRYNKRKNCYELGSECVRVGALAQRIKSGDKPWKI
jgi:hypothetical protein